MERDLAIDALVRFARHASDGAATKILDRLADAIVEHVHESGVVIVEIDTNGVPHTSVVRKLDREPASISIDRDSMGAELGRDVLRSCGAPFEHAETLMLVADGSLFGAAVLLFPEGVELDDERRRIATGLVDLAAITLANALHIQKLERSYVELKESQAILARGEKLRALGQMAAGISHDLKNILNPLSLHIQIATRALARGKTADLEESLEEMKQVVVRGVEAVERLRSYSRQSKESKTELVDLEKLAREAAGIAKPRMASIGRVLKIVEDFHHPPAVMAVSGDLVSALVNLVVNAIDASAKKGTTVTLRSGEDDGGTFIEIEDDGPGMPPEVEKSVFEPFFTTKGLDGTGLGLAMVYATVQRHGGKITLDTEVGRGTRFRLWFPGGPLSG